ncbi:Clavaminate synthase-like protein [Coccomyxa subellipsoidea C-169]|uniref:Clavaminate synthase-like protein n=1 Tax=Coccomyxa subellipsoidea (strain C-169) TaxID=574566 RepID=I0Z8H4_COCSC|nr:Clavaminate synthase-like protein [Coccomyxa subellipsoidea C-169]EIE26943.1 Clavaminate synthase-like protein [Coccomyxa subellipsoidea C-169]|eukprot:XP_005651487.1 Clavaminate synthase-like protein [Coccomyxa subellipsoidea C-169]
MWQGDALVEVEHREGSKGRFGEGCRKQMRFGEFLERLAAGDDTLYLTTQEARASSGLHHDFHDNLYVLLRGRKRFTLFPPSLAKRMHTHGQIRLIHPSGRIVYEGRGDILADGSDAAEVDKWERRRSAEAELEAAEAASARGEAGAAKRLAAAEQALDAVLEAALKEAADDDYSESEEEGAFSGSDAEGLPEDFHDDYVDSEAEAESGDAAARNGRSCGAAEASNATGDGDLRPGVGLETKGEKAEPDSFSRVDLSAGEAEVSAQFPDFPGLQSALQFDVHAGEMLYLPAGWFHEVQSFGNEHMALNYWTHPPDNLDPGPGGFSKPYVGDYWPTLWALRQCN